MYSRRRTWEVPVTATTGSGNKDTPKYLALDDHRPLYSKPEIDQIGIVDPVSNQCAEFRLIHPDGRTMELEYILPWPNRHPRGASLYFISAGLGFGIVFFNMRRQSAWFIEIERFADPLTVPPGINLNDYDLDDWFVRLKPAGLLFDSQLRIWMGAHLSPTSHWNPVFNGICRWELLIARSRYVTVWRLDANAKGLAKRLWRDQLGRIWWVHQAFSSPGGYMFSCIDPATNDITGFDAGTLGTGMALGGERDLFGLAGDGIADSLWLSWPRFRRLFNYPDIYTTPHPGTELHAHFEAQAGVPAPAPAFGKPSSLFHDRAGGIYYGNQDDAYAGRLETDAAPDEIWPLNYTPNNFTPMLMELKRTPLTVEKVFEGPVPTHVVPVSDYEDVHAPFAGWQTDVAPDHLVRDRDWLWCIEKSRHLSRLEL